MNNSSEKGGVVAQRNIKSKTYMSSCVDCPAKDGLITILVQEKRVQVDCKLLDGMVNGSLINTRELVKKILAKNPDIQCPVIASANRLMTTAERVIEEEVARRAAKQVVKAEAPSTPTNPADEVVAPSTQASQTEEVATQL